MAPRVSLHQLQIKQCNILHRSVDNALTENVLIGTEVDPQTKGEQIVKVQIPPEIPLTIKSTILSIKYFIHVTLAIVHSFDLHVNVPIILTSKEAINEEVVNELQFK